MLKSCKIKGCDVQVQKTLMLDVFSLSQVVFQVEVILSYQPSYNISKKVNNIYSSEYMPQNTTVLVIFY